MIYEMRRYILQPGKTGEWVRAFCEAYEVRVQYSPLGALFQTEIGPLKRGHPHLALREPAAPRGHSRRGVQGHQRQVAAVLRLPPDRHPGNRHPGPHPWRG